MQVSGWEWAPEQWVALRQPDGVAGVVVLALV